MKKITSKFSFWTFAFMFCLVTSYAQVGINTTTPDASSMLDVTSTTKGMLTPRMTTVQKNAITTPTNALLVYDTTLKLFSYYDLPSTSWVNLAGGRNNFKRIKSTDILATILAAELAVGGGSKYVLNTNTLYEINGQVVFNFPIDLNNAYIQGIDSGDDKIVRTIGNMFDGATGGTIRGLTLVATAGKVFNLSGVNTENLIFRDCIVANSNAVGTINGLGLVFLSVVQFSNNTTGITYSNISQLLLSNLGWFANSKGTFEKLTGTFGLVQKQGGFSDVTSANFAFDVSDNPTISGDAVLESVVFTGPSAKYVNPYTTGTYIGYNFNNSWNVRSTGIPNETDADAVGSFFMDYSVGSGASTPFLGPKADPTVIKKVEGVSSSDNLFRFSDGGGANNKLIYLGKKKRFFQVTGSISFQVPALGTYIVYIAKNGTPISQSKVYGRGNATSDIVVLPLNALVELSNSQYVEVFVQRYSSTNNNDSILTPNMTITIK